MAYGNDDGENEVFSDETDSEEEQSPTLIAKNAGANLRSPAGAAINRKRKLYGQRREVQAERASEICEDECMGSYQGVYKPTLL